MTSDDRIAELEALNRRLREDNQRLTDRVDPRIAQLEADNERLRAELRRVTKELESYRYHRR